jgi:hypothetical protein
VRGLGAGSPRSAHCLTGATNEHFALAVRERRERVVVVLHGWRRRVAGRGERRARLRERVRLPVERRERNAHQVEQLALAVAEIAPLAVEYEAHEQAIVDIERQGERVVEADARVVVGVKRRRAERRAQQIKCGARRRRVRCGAHQRMLAEMAVDASSSGQPTHAGIADDAALAGDGVASEAS